jgi:hypothetical protein
MGIRSELGRHDLDGHRSEKNAVVPRVEKNQVALSRIVFTYLQCLLSVWDPAKVGTSVNLESNELVAAGLQYDEKLQCWHITLVQSHPFVKLAEDCESMGIRGISVSAVDDHQNLRRVVLYRYPE